MTTPTDKELRALSAINEAFERGDYAAAQLLTRKKVLGLLDRIAGLEEENRKLKSPNMFWNADDPERCFGGPEELIESIWDYGGERGGIVEVQCAVTVENEFYAWRERDETKENELDRFDYFQVPAEKGREITQGTLAAYWIAKFARRAAKAGGTDA